MDDTPPDPYPPVPEGGHEVALDEIRERLEGMADDMFGAGYPGGVLSADLMQSRHMLSEIELLASQMRRRCDRRIVAEWCSDTAGVEVYGDADGHRFKAVARWSPASQKWSESTAVLDAISGVTDDLAAALAAALPLRTSWRATALRDLGVDPEGFRSRSSDGTWRLSVDRVES